jgi:hypothetical protein
VKRGQVISQELPGDIHKSELTMKNPDLSICLDFFKRNGYARQSKPNPVLVHTKSSADGSNVTDRDLEFLRHYCIASLLSGKRFFKNGICIGSDEYIHLDKAVIKRCIDAGLLLDPDKEEFYMLTSRGLAKLGLLTT